MNLFFTAFFIMGTVLLLFSDPNAVLDSLIKGGSDGLTFCLKLYAIYAVWLSILNLWEKMHFNEFLGKNMRFVLRKIFPNESEKCYDYLSVNLSANMLGMGSAGTPAGIDATENMTSKKNKIMLIVINSSSVQLIPTTMIALRSSAGATTDIILPSILATIVTTLTGFALVKIFVR